MLKISKRQVFLFTEKVLIVLSLFVMTRPVVQYSRIGGVDIQFGLIILLYGVFAAFAFLRLEHFLYIVARDKLLLILIGLPFLSLVWSINPMDTIQGLIIFIGATFLGFYMAMRFSLREQLVLLAWLIAIIVITSTLLALFVPSIGRGIAAGEFGVWTGIFTRKNGLGRFMAIGAVVFWVFYRNTRSQLSIIGFCCCCILMLLARSATSVVTLVIVLSVQPIYQALKVRSFFTKLLIIVPGGLLLAGIVGYLYWQPDTFFELLGRNPERNTLQVRLTLWDEIIPFIWSRPILGYGFDGFWGDGRVMYGWTRLGWTVNQAHNGYVEIVLQLGIVGLTLVMIHFVRNFQRAFRITASSYFFEGTWSFNYLLILLILNLSYSMVLGQLTVPWTLYVSLTATMCMMIERTRRIARTKQIA